ncbi:hypothetical protein [Bradyrhizobium viridifuturi]|uniref:hypothetical protein n=1 Tax=Bradyrhizobium viridifuturi TaxID=1654716 RepID=UPI000A632BC1|nr:hypothetical protein [Bradyrhizobium viridifuturi]
MPYVRLKLYNLTLRRRHAFVAAAASLVGYHSRFRCGKSLQLGELMPFRAGLMREGKSAAKPLRGVTRDNRLLKLMAYRLLQQRGHHVRKTKV